MATTWMGARPDRCQICHAPIKRFFIDGKTTAGPWAIMCVLCHIVAGVGLGTGKGQKYDHVTLKKVEG